MFNHRVLRYFAAATILCGSVCAKTFVVEYDPLAISPAAAAAAALRAGGTVTANHAQLGMLFADSENPDFGAVAGANRGISRVTEDLVVNWLPDVQANTTDFHQLVTPEPSLAPGPPLGASLLFLQWNIFKVQANLAWTVTQGNAAVKVAVLDTGICAHHIDLAGKVDAAQSASFVPAVFACPPTPAIPVPPACIGCPAWEDRHFHGTHVAGTISSNNHGTAGIAPNVRLRAVKVLNCFGGGAFSWVISGIMYAADNGNDVINMSLGAYFPKNGGPGPALGPLVAALNKAVNYAHSKGVLVVSAAGNSGIDLDSDQNFTAVPCQSGSGMCTGSTTISDALSSFSNHGVSGPQIVAPGGGTPTAPFSPTVPNRFILAPCSRHSVLIPICGTIPAAQFYLFVAGTSMAAPHVAGAAALVDSIARQGPGSANAGQLSNALLNSADDLGRVGTDNTFSRGRLNVFKAVQ